VQLIHADRDHAQRIDVETESVSSSTASFGSSTAICSISLRFFSPPKSLR
jgi:hypothetical protein